MQTHGTIVVTSDGKALLHFCSVTLYAISMGNATLHFCRVAGRPSSELGRAVPLDVNGLKELEGCPCPRY